MEPPEVRTCFPRGASADRCAQHTPVAHAKPAPSGTSESTKPAPKVVKARTSVVPPAPSIKTRKIKQESAKDEQAGDEGAGNDDSKTAEPVKRKRTRKADADDEEQTSTRGVNQFDPDLRPAVSTSKDIKSVLIITEDAYPNEDTDIKQARKAWRQSWRQLDGKEVKVPALPSTVIRYVSLFSLVSINVSDASFVALNRCRTLTRQSGAVFRRTLSPA
jgi:hypothetical protein